MWIVLRVTPDKTYLEGLFGDHHEALITKSDCIREQYEQMDYEDDYVYDPRMDDRYEILEIDF